MFVEMLPSLSDLDYYQENVICGMLENDTYPALRLKQKLEDQSVKAWFYFQDDNRVGWCALKPSHNKYSENCWHLFGSWVHDNYRGQGIARKMWKYRLNMIPKDCSASVCIQSDRIPSLKLAKHLGFEETGLDDVWLVFLKQ